MQPAQTPPAPPLEHAERLTKAAAALGYEIVDIAGFLDLVERHAQAQSAGLNTLRARADEMARTNEDVRGAVETIATQTKASVEDVEASVHLVRRSGEQSREIAGWVQNVAIRTQEVQGTVQFRIKKRRGLKRPRRSQSDTHVGSGNSRSKRDQDGDRQCAS